MTWFALVAMLALAPTMSHAFAKAGRLLASICSAGDSADLPAGPADAVAQHLDHCPFCILQAQALGPLPSMPSPLMPAGLSAELPQRFFQAASTPFAWRTAQPRGPPAYS